MKGPGTVYRKLREVKYKHLTVLYKKFFKKTPENCKYNCRYVFYGENLKREIRICMLHQNTLNLKDGIIPHLLDVCEELGHSFRCNAFIPRYSKGDVKNLFEEELKNRAIKEKKYPDVCALEWVMEKSVVGLPPINWIQALYFRIKRRLLKNRIL